MSDPAGTMVAMPRWTTHQVLDAAPDASSAAAARKLAKPGPWSETGANDTLVWGKCQGSGKTPYQVSVDLSRPAYTCSCPSRKFPCKHCLALLLLWAESDGNIADRAEAAGFAAEWQAKAAATQAVRAARVDKPVDAEAQAKRLEQRLGLMDAGIVDFRLWLNDLVRTGLASARTQPYSWWDAAAARLVDAQLPGLADQVRTMASTVSGRPDWSDHLLSAVGRWWLTTQAWQQRSTLDADTMADLRVTLGWSIPSAEVRAGATPITDTWHVLGAHRTDDGRVQQQRTWVRGDASQETAMVLDFAAGGAPLPMARAVGSTLTGGLVHHPGHRPWRAILDDDIAPGEQRDTLPQGGTLTEGLEAYARQLAENPWAHRQPWVVDHCRLTLEVAIDGEGHQLPLPHDVDPVPALALTGGHPVRCFGEIEGARFRPLTIETIDGLGRPRVGVL